MLVKLQAFTGAEQPPNAIRKIRRLHSQGWKKETLEQVFSVNLAEFLRITFLQNTSGRLLLLLAFQKQPPEVFYKKMCSWKCRKVHWKTPLICKTSGRLFLAFSCNVIKWDTANSVWKTSDEYSLSRNTNLRSTVQLYPFFFQQNKLSVYVFIGLHSLLPEDAIRVEVFCKKRCS